VYNGRKTENDDRTLDDVRFATGDYIDVAIVRPGAGRPDRGPRGSFGRDSFGGRRENFGNRASGADRWERSGPLGGDSGPSRDRRDSGRDRDRDR